MDEILVIAWVGLLAVNLASFVIAAWRVAPADASPGRCSPVPVSIVVPTKGVEPFTEETLRAAFELDWPTYELIFCVADASDPVAAEIQKAMSRHPHIPSRLLVGDDRISANPKLNNCHKGWLAARYEWVVLADSNVLMPADYLHRLFVARRHDTGLVCSTPLGSRPSGFAAEVECAFLNSHQARWQYTGEAIGWGFAQGKSMLWHKPLLDAQGGVAALAAETAEDAAATKLVNRMRLKVHLVAGPFEQPLGRRSFLDVWARQRRWARLRRVSFPAFFAPEILTGALPPLILGLAASATGAVHPLMVVALTLAATYLAELALSNAKRWHVSAWSLPAMVVRDFLLPAIWICGWLGTLVEWRGNTMRVSPGFSELETTRQRGETEAVS